MKKLQIILLIFLALMLSACLKKHEENGHVIKEENIDKIEIGKSHKQEVIRALGSPSSRSMFGDVESWYYSNSKSSSVAFLKSRVNEHNTIRISFDEYGYVAELQNYNEDNLQDVDFASDKTQTEGKDMSVFQQLLGNVGRFNTQEEAR